MPDSRRSILQAEIILHLQKGPAETITALADSIRALRPSVSRSLNTLKAQGLVIRTREGWKLTDEGEKEAVIVKEEFAEVLKKLQTSVGRVGDVIGRLGSFARFEDIIDTSSIVGNSMKPIVDMINQDISKIGAINLSNYIQESGTYDVLTSTLRNLNTGIFSSNALTSTKMAELMSDITSSQFDFGQVIQPLLDIQEHNAIIMRQLIQDLSPAEGLFSRNNRLIAGILEDALAIWQFGALPENYTAFHDTLLNFSDVNQSFRRLFDTVATPIILADPNLDLSKLSDSMIVPTMTMGYYTRSVRELVNTETETETNESPNQERTSEEFHELGDESLDETLARLNPEFVEMRKGAWWALRILGLTIYVMPEPLSVSYYVNYLNSLYHKATCQRITAKDLN